MDINSGLDELSRRREIGRQMGGPERIAKQHQHGHLTARERIEKLLDRETFVEVGLLEQLELPGGEGKVVPTSRIRGFGQIDGRTVVVHADDRTILAGSDEIGVGRRGGMAALSPEEVGCPIIGLGDGGGGRMQTFLGSANIMAIGLGMRGRMNPRKVPNIATIMGYCFGAPTWQAASADIVVMVKGCCMAVSGPRVLEVAKDEEITPEELGGWKLHAEVTGQVDVFAEDDEHCLRIVREVVGYLPSNCDEEPPSWPNADPPDRRVDEVIKILPEKSNRVYDMYRIIQALVDDGKYLALKPYYGKALITCLARMNGRTVGIIASQPNYNAGASGAEECEKATSFIVLCDSFNIPLIHLHDTPGFLVGAPAERGKIPLRIMVWMQALTLATVPKLSVIMRKSYGQALINMGAGGDPDFIVAWPTADISFMSPEAAANVVYFRHLQEVADAQAERAKLVKQMEYESAPWKAAAKGLLDDVIDPRDTRRYIINCLDILHRRRGGFISKKQLQSWPSGF